MDADEREICIYLKSYPNQYISGREICRRAGGKSRFRDDANWAIPILTRLVEQSIVEDDRSGHYRLVQKKTDKKKKWVSPHIKKMLEKSGKDFTQTFEIEDPDSEST
jgi:hypothetical protein